MPLLALELDRSELQQLGIPWNPHGLVVLVDIEPPPPKKVLEFISVCQGAQKCNSLCWSHPSELQASLGSLLLMMLLVDDYQRIVSSTVQRLDNKIDKQVEISEKT